MTPILTPAQLATLKTDITAKMQAGQPLEAYASSSPTNSDANTAIAAFYNQLAAPAFYGWHFTRSRMDCRRAILNTAGSANQLDALTGSKRDSLLWAVDDTIDCRLAAVRASIDDLCGSQNTLKAAVIDSFKKQLTIVQKLLATGTGSLAVPADNPNDGNLTFQEVEAARTLP